MSTPTYATGILLLISAVPCGAATLRVPSDVATIQGAIDAAENGDTVLVAQGIYDELIDFHGKTLALVSERGALRTTIDGQGGGTVITMQSGEGPGTLVEGFTITGGATSFGAGMYLEGTAPTVRNNIGLVTRPSIRTSLSRAPSFGGDAPIGTSERAKDRTASLTNGGVQTNERRLWPMTKPLSIPPSSFERAMQFQHSITVRSQPGKNGDYGRALERVAFFPGVTKAKLIGEDADSVTIGYNDRECVASLRTFRADLEADDLAADGPLWGDAPHLTQCNVAAAVMPRAERVPRQGMPVPRVFDRRSF